MDCSQCNEEWRAVVGYEGFYEVSSCGRVRGLARLDSSGRMRPSRMMTLMPTWAYLCAGLNRGGVQKRVKVHRLVCAAFIGECPQGMEVAHYDGDGHNNHVQNLRYATPRENHADKHRHGTALIGARNRNSKLDARSVAEMRYRFRRGSKIKALAREYGIHPKTAKAALKRKTWRHVS